MAVSENLKIEIRPIPNRDKIKSYSDNLEYFSAGHTIPPLVDSTTRRYKTGLTEEDKEWLRENSFPYEFETDNYIKGVAHSFWESSEVKVTLKHEPDFLFPGRNLMDFIKYKWLLQSSYIYSSAEEMLTGSKPEATHYIFNESEEIQLKAGELERRNTLITKIGKLSLKRKRDIILILLEETTENKDEDYLTVKFDEILGNKELSLILDELLSRTTEDVALSAEIKTAIRKNVLRKTTKGIYYFETNLGFSEDDVKENLSKDENQELYLNIKSKIQ